MYVLDSTTIRRPHQVKESNDTQVAVQRTLDGSINRDYFGSNKRVFELTYINVKKADFDTINTIYQSYLSTGTTKTFEVTESNYTVASTLVHITLDVREFSVRGSDYISDFTLQLVEA